MSLSPADLPRKRRWTRAYPPLVLLALAVITAVVILPSSLNLPQSDPATVLEYAPVPPEDDNPPPNEGNLSSLGLGKSNTLVEGAPPPPPPAAAPIEGVGGRPRQKRCVGNPPRQTEDPSSPPCVPFFDGDNFGATYQGVEKDEITVLVYFDVGGYSGGSGGFEGTPANGSYVDIDEPKRPACPAESGQNATDPKQCDHVLVRLLKGFSRYFNERFQTYDRHVHYWAYFTQADTAAERQSDAIANREKLHPFAAVDAATFGGFNQEYQAAMNDLDVLTFSSTEAGLPNEFYRKSAPKAWGFNPDVEHWAALYSSYVCKKVAPFPVKHYGNPQGTGAPNGEERRLGLWYTTDPGEPGLQLFADLVKTQLQRCGVEWVSEATFGRSGFAVDGGDNGADAADGAAKFQQDGVTTVLYLGGIETRFSASADALRYYPEIVVAGDLENDATGPGRVQNQNVWQNAWAMTYHIRINRLEDSPGYRAWKEGDPSGDDAVATYARDDYRDHFMLFQGIQVAGPRLTPESIDKGFHAIPERSSADPYAPAMYFDEGDYTAVKDSAEQWWDVDGRARNSNQPGCWRQVREGKRYRAGTWEGGDDVFANPADPCTGYGGSIRLRAG